MRYRTIVAVAFTGLIYGILASATIVLTSNGSGIATFWPPNAVLLAMIWVLPRQKWPPYILCGLAANIAANLLFRGSALATLPFAIANMSEVVLAAWLLGRTGSSSEALGNIALVVRFVIAGLIAPAVSGLAGAMTAVIAFGTAFDRAYATWFAADALGLLIVAPLALMVRTGELGDWYRQLLGPAKRQSATILLAVVLTAAVVFSQSRYPLLFIVFAPVILAACRIGRVGAALSLLAVALIGSWSTLEGTGPISLIVGDPWARILFFQLFLAVLLMTALPAAAELEQRRALIAKLAEREETLLLLLDQSADLILHLDLNGNCVFASGSGAALEACSPATVIGRNIAGLPHRDDVTAARTSHERAIRQPGVCQRAEYRLPGSSGAWIWIELNTRALTGPDGAVTGTVSALRDVSHHKLREADLHLAAQTDALTGIPNRAGFIEQLDLALQAPPDGGLWVGLLDIDHFKAVNDTHGHLGGDSILASVAERLRTGLRPGDAIGRVGGEEFAIMLAGVGEAGAFQIFNRLRESIGRSPAQLPNGVSVIVTLSGGFTHAESGRSRDDILAAADRALYRSKREGRNRMTRDDEALDPRSAQQVDQRQA